jgi:hypothetical protein
MQSFLCAALLSVGVLVAIDSSAEVDSTYLQLSGAECYSPTANAAFSRSYGGFQNTSTFPIVVECPVIDASDDSDLSNHQWTGARVAWRVQAPTNCKLGFVVVNTSSIYYSMTFVASGATVNQVDNNVFQNGTISVFLQCTLPSTSVLTGALLFTTISPISPGV